MYINPKKSLGQNFLIDKNIRQKILDSLKLKGSDTFLEIGAGKGELTSLISHKVAKVYALEIDRRLIKVLEEVFKNEPNVTLINEDILKFDLVRFFTKLKFKGKLKVFGNIPYYISSPIIAHLIESRFIIETIFMTVQKEFARRVVALPGSKDYGSLSCFVQYYTKPKIIFDISRNSFKPAPKVNSSFLELEIREEPAVFVHDEARLFKIIRASFNQRRKILRNSLGSLVSSEQLDIFFCKTNFDRNVRPEELGLKDFALLANL